MKVSFFAKRLIDGLRLIIGITFLLGLAYILFLSPQWGILQKIKFSQSLYPPQKSYIDTLQVFNMINDYRAANGLTKLLFDPYMCDFAQKRLQQIHTNFSHAGFQAEVLKAYCTNCRSTGENLAQGQSDEKDIVQAWLLSPEHLKNIVEPDFRLTCVAIDKYKDRWYSVQEFASNFE